MKIGVAVMNKLRQCLPPFLLSLCLNCSTTVGAHARRPGPLTQTTDKRLERERERAYAREQFTKNFRDLQLIGKGLLQDHEATKLTPGKLAKSARLINKCARTLRSLIALGEMASEIQIDKEIDTAGEFDESIRKLAGLISEFARNPVHQSNKVFNTDLAERAQTDLLTIINLSKALESKSKGYARSNLRPPMK
jgi:hypothetical protein